MLYHRAIPARYVLVFVHAIDCCKRETLFSPNPMKDIIPYNYAHMQDHFGTSAQCAAVPELTIMHVDCPLRSYKIICTVTILSKHTCVDAGVHRVHNEE